jgi:hypothetical protein
MIRQAMHLDARVFESGVSARTGPDVDAVAVVRQAARHQTRIV